MQTLVLNCVDECLKQYKLDEVLFVRDNFPLVMRDSLLIMGAIVSLKFKGH